jgi:hypothetical protein
MNRTFRKPLAVASITALGIATAVSMGFAQDGTGGNRGTATPVTAPSAGIPAPTANLLIGTANFGGDGVLMQASPFAVLGTFPGLFNNMSGLSNLPGTAIFSLGGGMSSGGQLFHFLGNGSLVGPFPTGYPSCSGLAWVNGGGALVGSAGMATIADGLIYINPLTGASTTNGTYGSGIGGLDSIAQDPTTGTLYGSTGFFYDGSPGDVITINITTGLATDTFTDMTPTPSCTVSGMSFDISGQGFVSTGCNGPGNVYSWNTSTNAITLLGAGSTGSMTDIQALF